MILHQSKFNFFSAWYKLTMLCETIIVVKFRRWACCTRKRLRASSTTVRTESASSRRAWPTTFANARQAIQVTILLQFSKLPLARKKKDSVNVESNLSTFFLYYVILLWIKFSGFQLRELTRLQNDVDWDIYSFENLFLNFSFNLNLFQFIISRCNIKNCWEEI